MGYGMVLYKYKYKYNTRSCDKKKKYNKQFFDCQKRVENVLNILPLGDKIKKRSLFASLFSSNLFQ